jgi:hypothetical protein
MCVRDRRRCCESEVARQKKFSSDGDAKISAASASFRYRAAASAKGTLARDTSSGQNSNNTLRRDCEISRRGYANDRAEDRESFRDFFIE